MKLITTKSRHLKAAFYSGLVGSILGNDSAFASLASLTQKTAEVNTLVSGPLGAAVMIVGTIGGFVGAIMNGKIMLAVAIVIIGVLLGIQIESIRALFPTN